MHQKRVKEIFPHHKNIRIGVFKGVSYTTTFKKFKDNLWKDPNSFYVSDSYGKFWFMNNRSHLSALRPLLWTVMRDRRQRMGWNQRWQVGQRGLYSVPTKAEILPSADAEPTVKQ